MALFAKLLGAGILTGGAGIYYLYKDEEKSRAFKLWTRLGPIITHYRIIEAKQKLIPVSDQVSDAEYLDLHMRYADSVLDALLDLRGFYIKIGQVMAHRNDILHEIYIEKLRILEDQVPPPLDSTQVKEIVAKSLGVDSIHEKFKDFEDKPLGSASIGQVHKATLLDGSLVAVKVQDPNAENLFRSDIKAARNFCKTFAPEQLIIFDEIERQFLTEFDYRAEAGHLETVRKNMKPFKYVVVPRVYPELCTKQVLTMEFLKGPKLIDGIRFKELETELRAKFEKEGLPPPYQGPSAFTLELYRKGIRLFDKLVNIHIWSINQTLWLARYLTGLDFFNKKFEYHHSFIPLNSSFIMDTLLKAHGHQLLIDGFFNADCHPGNFLLLEDGKIAFIDYGQVKKISKQDRLQIAELIIAIANKDKQRVTDIMLNVGAKSKHNDRSVMYRMAIIGFDQDGRNVTDGLNLQQFMDKMFAIDPWEKFADVMIMPMRLSLLLRGVGLMLNHPVSVCTAWKPIAELALNKE